MMAVALVVAGAAGLIFLVWGDHDSWPKGWPAGLGWVSFFAITLGMLILRT